MDPPSLIVMGVAPWASVCDGPHSSRIARGREVVSVNLIMCFLLLSSGGGWGRRVDAQQFRMHAPDDRAAQVRAKIFGGPGGLQLAESGRGLSRHSGV